MHISLEGGGQAPSGRRRVLAKVVGPAKPALVRYDLCAATKIININEVLDGHVALEVDCADQRDAVWRALSKPTVLLAHSVGACKTATMVMAGAELKRLGLVNQPAYVVPSPYARAVFSGVHAALPQAKVLIAAREDVPPPQRKELTDGGERRKLWIWRAANFPAARSPTCSLTSRDPPASCDSSVIATRRYCSSTDGCSVKPFNVMVASRRERREMPSSTRSRRSLEAVAAARDGQAALAHGEVRVRMGLPPESRS